jgi:hypothetical protein
MSHPDHFVSDGIESKAATIKLLHRLSQLRGSFILNTALLKFYLLLFVHRYRFLGMVMLLMPTEMAITMIVCNGREALKV